MRVDDGGDEQLWSEVVESDRHYLGRRSRFIREAVDATSVLKQALATVAGRGPALRFLRTLAGHDLSRAVLPDVVRLASETHADTVLARQVIADLRHQPWLAAELGEIGEALRVEGDEERYRRLAELLADVDVRLLESHLECCRRSNDPAIREIAKEFES
jgi:hypothetical protein